MVLAASQIWWTWEVEDVFRRFASSNKASDKAAMKILARQQHAQVEDIAKRVRGNLSANDRKKLTTLLIIDIHSRDIVDGFVRDTITQVGCLSKSLVFL